MDPRGCRWQRLSEADPLGLTDFPNLGVSQTFDQAGGRWGHADVTRLPGDRWWRITNLEICN